MPPDRLRFDGLLDLARLPFFEVKEGRLRVADSSLRGAVDVHTHLSLSYGPGKADLLASTPETETYLPARHPVDLELYANKNFTKADLAAIERDLALGSIGPAGKGMRRTHTIPNLRREMEEMGVAASVLLAIDFPVFSRNSEAWAQAARPFADLVCFAGVHALSPGLRARLDRLVALGVRGVKVHPAVQLLPPDADACMRLYRLCGERGLVVTFHCGPVDIETRLGRRFSQVRRYERALAECPQTRFVLGHSGALQMDLALGFAQKYRNVWLEISSQGLPAVQRILGEGPADRVLFGSDWPFYHPAIPLAKLALAARQDDALKRRVLYENARALLAAGPTA